METLSTLALMGEQAGNSSQLRLRRTNGNKAPISYFIAFLSVLSFG